MAARTTGVHFFIPTTFDLANFPTLVEHADEVHWFLNYLSSTAHAYRHEHRGEGYVDVHRDKLRRFMGRRMEVIRNTLLAARVVETDGKFILQKHDRDGNGKATGYRVAAPYRTGFRMVACRSRTLARKVLYHRICRNDHPVHEHELDGIDAHLHANLKRLRIDRDAAVAVIEDVVAAAMADDLDTRLARRAACLLTVDQMIDQQDHPQVDWCPYGRFHTVVTRLLTGARDCLTIDGQHLVGIDIRNSQVVFLVLLIIESFLSETTTDAQTLHERDNVFGWPRISRISCNPVNPYPVRPEAPYSTFMLFTPLRGRGREGERDGMDVGGTVEAVGVCVGRNGVVGEGDGGGEDENENRVGLEREMETSVTTYEDMTEADHDERYPDEVRRTMRPTLLDKLDGLPLDVLVFIARTLDGTIYDEWMGELGVTDRRAFKTSFFRAILYGNPKRLDPADRPLAEAFAAKYPTVDRFIRWAKRERYKELPQRMQARESRFMFGQVVNRLWRHHRDVPLVTIHDSILTTPEHVETVRRIMIEEFEKLGITPAVKVG